MDNVTVFIVEDDEAAARSLVALMMSIGLKTITFVTAEAFLEEYKGESGCLLLDVRLPGMSGIELQTELAERKHDIPIVFMSGHADAAIAQRAIRNGAIAFLQKPFAFEELNSAIRTGLARIADLL
jgi:FixJ family two-component response regulator